MPEEAPVSRIVCTPGGPLDNCYVELEDADAYFAAGFVEDQWAQFAVDLRERALIQATRDVEKQGGARRTTTGAARVLFVGAPYYSSLEYQALHFPRTNDLNYSGTAVVIPQPIKDAVCEQALWLLQKRTAPELVDRAALQAQGVTSMNLDGLQETYGRRSCPAGMAPQAWDLLRGFVNRSFGVTV